MAEPQTLKWSQKVFDWLRAELGVRGEVSIDVASWRLRVKAHEGSRLFTWDVRPLDEDGAMRFRGITNSADAACFSACDALERATPHGTPAPLTGKALTGAMDAALQRNPTLSMRRGLKVGS